MSASPDAVVAHEVRGHAFWITIDRPERRNALNAEVIAGIREGLRRAHEEPQVRAIVLTGAGDKAFCAGADLNPGGGFAFDLSRSNLDYADMLRDSQRATLPIVARVQGTCVAGGMGLLCMADIAVASTEAKFGLPEVKVGVFPMQVMSLLTRVVPRRKAREWALTGEMFGAQEALESGLVNYAVAPGELDAKVQWLVDKLAEVSPTAVRRGLYAMHAIEAMSFEQALAYTEGQIVSLAMTEDAREGMAAFNEKRAPRWTGK
ncbi:MAG TPA: enoyl-CoA hydratase/isomerase family protein [Ramlibacter sp.]|uniref:enoyl-CoA hydratase/isomerase family protein n=1 Tax=Ramlibacter sp. TaxID=1917967 RepID=UPI002B8A0500|nr:enoyl-CoA hydratase/isomerase family protein [Ramlibacter sp.]HVZ42349.1 enoyl-CoA hydratase/isomerase family protein [Ramlibacter sp.]